MKHLFLRGLSLLLLLALVASFLPMIPTVSAADKSTDIYQLPSRTLNDAGTKYRQQMSYIIRSRNGKIIVIDGGYSTNNLDANYLISQLKSITGKDVPNIDAWFITHDHEDHVGAFKAIAARMPEKVTVSAVYYRFPTDAEIDKYAPESSRASLKKNAQSFRNHVALMKKADGTPTDTVTVAARHVDKCNSTFYFDSVQIDVLMTCQEVFWGCDNITTKYSGNLSNNGKAYTSQTIKQLVEADFGNNTSLVFRLSTMGQSVLFMGDAAEPEGLMLKYFHDQNAANSNKYFSLKSDVVQMAHHGQNAVPKSVYVAIDPSIAMWPCPDWVYTPSSSSSLTTEYTKKWMSELGVTNYISKDGLKKVALNDITVDTTMVIPEELKALIFDATYYADRYADLKKAFGYDEAKLYAHFLNHGIKEGRCASHYFDIKYYISQNSAKMADYCKGNCEKGMKHFLKYAYLESELTGGGAKKLSMKFDCKYYYNNYPILKELGLKTEFEILQYFITTGKAAGHKAAEDVVTLNNHVSYHTVKHLPAVSATCTAEGKTAGKECSLCGLVLTAQTPVAKLAHTPVEIPAVEATCTETGLTAGEKCGVCGEILTAQTVIDAHGHSYSYEDAGQTHTVTCATCGDNFTEAHSYVDSFCICGNEEIKEPLIYEDFKIYHTLNLASGISLTYAVPKSLLEGFDMETVYMDCTMEGTTIRLLPTEEGNYYYFTLNDLTAVRMNDRVQAVLYGTKDRQPYYSATDDYSIADYAYAQLNSASAESHLKTLCADLLRYGAAAQTFKHYRTENLADSAMTEVHRAYLSDLEAVTFSNVNSTLNDLESPAVAWVGKTLSLDSKVSVKYVVNVSGYQGDLEALSLRLSYMDINGNGKTAEVTELEVYNEEKGWCSFTFDGLLAAELRCALSARVYAGSTPISVTLCYSPDTYGNGQTGTLGHLCKALFAYSDSAKAFFAK